MKKLLTLSILVLLLGTTTACTKYRNIEEQLVTKTNEQTNKKVDKINLESKEGTLTYLDYQLDKDYENKNAIILYFNYTNKQEESSRVRETFDVQVFQNGIESEVTFLDKYDEINNTIKEVQKGISLNVAFSFLVEEMDNPITIKVTDRSDILNPVYQEQELVLDMQKMKKQNIENDNIYYFFDI